MEVFDEDFGVAAGGFVGGAAGGGEGVGGGDGVAEFFFEEAERLGAEGDEAMAAAGAGGVFGEGDEFLAVAAIFVGAADEEAGEFAGADAGGGVVVGVDGDGGDGVAVEFEDEEVAEFFVDLFAGAGDEGGVVDGLLHHGEQGGDVGGTGGMDLLVVVSVDHGADAFVAEEFGEEGFFLAAVDDVDAGDAFLTGDAAVAEFGEEVDVEGFGGVLGELAGVDGGDLGDALAFQEEAGFGDEDDFGGAEGDGDFDGDGVGVEAEGGAAAVVAHGLEDGDDVGFEEGLEAFDVDTFDAAGEFLVDAVDDAGGVDGEGVGDGDGDFEGGEVGHEEAGLAGDGGDGDVHAGGIGAAHAVVTGEFDAAFDGEVADLGAGAVDEDDFDVQGLEDGDVLEEGGEAGLFDEVAIDGDDEDALPELGDVAEDAAKVFEAGRVGFGEVRLGHGGSSCNWGGRPRGFLECGGQRAEGGRWLGETGLTGFLRINRRGMKEG